MRKKAKVVKIYPFTIQLLFETGNKVQEITLSVDAGSKHIGLSAVTAKQELFAADVELRNDSTSLLSTRRNRKTRYRKSRFLNRVSSKKKDGLR